VSWACPSGLSAVVSAVILLLNAAKKAPAKQQAVGRTRAGFIQGGGVGNPHGVRIGNGGWLRREKEEDIKLVCVGSDGLWICSGNVKILVHVGEVLTVAEGAEESCLGSPKLQDSKPQVLRACLFGKLGSWRTRGLQTERQQ